ncbi:hypothetical protein [Pseudobacteriovorax antillogorgiicola]|uniref:Uncharacterized protein n=1 Tax=Pseudobacteriovorax antillogorgiicola TaxID=1513793 RepID=A0A1Y6CG94_9BACT|nr:hypothetical protein [Pseudobacteriovorax antillogorgiicola]TCS47623.1 hypothetical protein EDD56_12064 [Pseudobacteriovorax antillogorgiicola]SMF60014.1 hypothetical protein SAMN06296036_12076 [Pseudobacteriovorax antillogorgiicola]
MKSLLFGAVALVGSALMIGLLIGPDDKVLVHNVDHDFSETSSSKTIATSPPSNPKEGLKQVRLDTATESAYSSHPKHYQDSRQNEATKPSKFILEKEQLISRVLRDLVGARALQALDIASIEEYLSTHQLQDFSSFRQTDFKQIKEIEPDISGLYEGVINFDDISAWIVKLALHIDSVEEPLRGELELKIMDENKAVLMNSQLQGSLDGLIQSFEKTKQGFSLIIFTHNKKSGKLLQLFFKKTRVDDVVIGNFYRPHKQQSGYTRPEPLILVRVG